MFSPAPYHPSRVCTANEWRKSWLSRIRLNHDYADSRVMPMFDKFSSESLMIPAKMSA